MRQASAGLWGATRDDAMLARLGGDEFALLLSDVDIAAEAAAIAERIVSAISSPFTIDGRQLVIGASVGIAMAPQDGDTAEILMKNADLALYKAKNEGRSTYHFFESGMDAAIQKRRTIEAGLRLALARGELRLVYQPLVDLRTGATAGFEALARWSRPAEGAVPPAEFIPLAEEFGHIKGIGEFVLGQACAAAARWRSGEHPLPFVAVNVSTMQLDDPAFPATVARILGETGLEPSRLEIEITESVIMRDPDLAIRRLEALRDLGVSIAIDDFGTGYSSLGMLSRLPVTRLKIDRSFVAGFGESRSTSDIVSMIVDLCRHLDLEVTAEGVETDAQMHALAEAGIDLGQGFVFSRPVADGETKRLLDMHWLPSGGSRASA